MRLLLAMTLLSVFTAGCGGCSESASDKASAASASVVPNEPQFQVELSPEQEARSRELAALLATGKPVPTDQRFAQENYLPFVHLALHSDREFVVAQSLSAMRESVPDSAARPDVAPEVVSHFLNASDQRIVGGALHAAKPFLGRTPHRQVLKSTLALLEGKQVTATMVVAVLEALGGVRASSLSPAVFSEAQNMLSRERGPGEVYCASALAFLLSSSGALEKVDVTESLLVSEQAGVRALAARAFARKHGRQAVPQLLVLLKDDAAVVRMSAAWMLGEVGDASSIDALMPLIADDEQAVAKVTGASSLFGVPLQVNAGWSTLPTPAVAAMLSIEELSKGSLKLEPFVGDVTHATAENRKTIRRWYATRPKR